METHFDKLLRQSHKDSSLLMELVAIYLEEIASSQTSAINKKHQQVIDVLNQSSSKSPLAPILAGLSSGTRLFYLTQFEKAKQLLIEAKKQFTKGMPQDILGAIIFILGANYRSLGEIDKAADYLIQATQIINKTGLFKITYAYANYQLGEIHVAIGEYNSAQTYYQEALTVVSQSTNKSANFRINDGLGVSALYLKDYETSKAYFNTALSIQGLSAAEQSRGLCDLGNVFIKQGKYKEAQSYLEQSYELRIEHNLEDAASTSLIHLAEVHIHFNETDKAIKQLQQALDITKKFKAQSKKIKVLHLLAIAFQKKNKPKEALEYFSQYDKLNNEIRSEQEHEIFRLKNRQIEEQKLKLQEQHNQLKDALDELTKVKTSRKSLFFSIGTAISLVILTEAFFDPLIDSYAYNVYLSLAVKVFIALLLKPMDSFYERILLKRAMKLK